MVLAIEMLRLNFPDLAKSLSLPEENALSNLLAKSFNQSLTQGTHVHVLLNIQILSRSYPNFLSKLTLSRFYPAF